MAPTGNGLLGSNGFSLALPPRFTFGGSNVVAILESACKEIGVPATIASTRAVRSGRAI